MWSGNATELQNAVHSIRDDGIRLVFVDDIDAASKAVVAADDGAGTSGAESAALGSLFEAGHSSRQGCIAIIASAEDASFISPRFRSSEFFDQEISLQMPNAAQRREIVHHHLESSIAALVEKVHLSDIPDYISQVSMLLPCGIRKPPLPSKLVCRLTGVTWRDVLQRTTGFTPRDLVMIARHARAELMALKTRGAILPKDVTDIFEAARQRVAPSQLRDLSLVPCSDEVLQNVAGLVFHFPPFCEYLQSALNASNWILLGTTRSVGDFYGP